MRIKLSYWLVLSFLSFNLLLTQLHELSHIIAGRLICGAWGFQADFNIWHLYNGCSETNSLAFIASLAGPFFSYVMVYLGIALLIKGNDLRKLLGFALVFSNKPFAHIFTALMGSGDEITALRIIMVNNHSFWLKFIGIAVVLLIALPPLIIAYRYIHNRFRFVYLIGLCILPMLFQWVYEFKFLNFYLYNGFLSESHAWGISDFIWVHTFLMAGIFYYSSSQIIKKYNSQFNEPLEAYNYNG